jgi:hypothetical protein
MNLNEVAGTWIGTAELWEDPSGDIVKTSDCTMTITADSVAYTWVYDGTPHEGVISLAESGLSFQDTWHQKEEVSTERVPNSASLATVHFTYAEEWGWRINVCYRTPTEELVVQMTNIAPWGEEARAVRMACHRV